MYSKKLILTFLAIFISFIILAQNNLDILKHNINLYINPLQQDICGYTTLTIKAQKNTNKISLYLWGPTIDSVFINNSKTKFTQNFETFTIKYKLSARDTILLTVYYHGHPEHDPQWGGFFFKRGYAFNYGIGMTSNPLSVGRTWFPTDDSFTDKALFDFNISTPKDMKAICNGLLIDSILSDTTIVWHWHLAEPIPPYLANVAVGHYKKTQWLYNGLEKNIPVEIFTFSSLPYKAIKSLDNLNKVMNLYEHLLGPYPWEKIGYVQTPMEGGAMEHATNISLPFYAINGTKKYETLAYHELAHSWFGDYVTCKTFKDMWLNEGWAEYMSFVSLSIHCQKRFEDELIYNHLQALNLAHINDNGYYAIGKINLTNTYGSTIYKKGADVVHNLRYQIGDSLFWPAIRHYLQHFAWKNATIDDLRDYLEKFTDQKLDNFFKFWIYSPGFPLFYVNNFSVKRISKSYYQVIVSIGQKLIATDKYLSDQRLELGFVDNIHGPIIKQTFSKGKLTIDTFYLNFEPKIVFIDPYNHLLDASTHQYYWIDTAGNYWFDYEFFDLKIPMIKNKFFLRVKTNWLSPEKTLIDNNRFLLNSSYYWTIKSTKDSIPAISKFYLSSLIDINFRTLNKKQLKALRLFYRPNPNSNWIMLKTKLSIDYQYLSIDFIKPGEYIIGLDRKMLKKSN